MHWIRPVEGNGRRRVATVPLMVRNRISRLVIGPEGVRAEVWDRVRRRWRSLGGGLFEIAVISDGRPATGAELAEAGMPRDLWPNPVAGPVAERSDQAG